MTRSQLEYVLAVAETRHFGSAAEKCFVSQSTLSTMIIKFEEQLGIELFNRKTKPVSLTREGEELVLAIRLILRQMDDFDEKVKELKGELSGALRIGVIPTIAPYLLPLFLEEFARKHPNIQFSIQEANTAQMIELLKHRLLDVGITAIPLQEDDLVEWPLYKEPFVGFYADGFPGSAIGLRDIDSQNFWLLEDGHCMSAQMRHICAFGASANRGSNLSFKAGSIQSLISMTESSGGHTILPYLSTLHMSPAQKAALVPFQEPVPMRHVGLVVHQHFVKKRILKLLKEEICGKVLPLLPLAGTGKVIEPA